MNVLAGPRLDLDPAGPAARLCAALAGEDGEVVSLAALGLRNPYRRFSAAEIDALRKVLAGEAGVVGYVCTGVAAGAAPAEAGGAPESAPGPGAAGADAAPLPSGASGAGPQAPARAVVVTDHVNLTWRSPLTGPNDERLGPRFPAMDGIYAPDAAAAAVEAAMGPASALDGMIVSRGVVAGVLDDRALGAHESETAARFGWAAVSSELVAPVIIAAHMGLRVAAIVVVR